MNDSEKKLDIYINKKIQSYLYNKKKLKMGVLLGFWLLVHQLGYQVFLEFQSCFKFQLFLK